MKNDPVDSTLDSIIELLKSKYKCHSALLYGSRARGAASSISDYDVVGVCKRGSKTRVAKRKDGVFWDLFIYPERDLRKLNEQHLSWRHAKVLFEKKQYGQRLVRRIQKHIKKPFKPAPAYEIDVTRAWPEKQFDRIAVGDVHGLYRRIELQAAAVGDYFQIRRKQFWGPKAGLQWIAQNDPRTFKLFTRVFESPADIRALKALVNRVYKVRIR